MSRRAPALLDVAQARRDLRRFSAQLYRTEPRALKLAGSNTRRAYVSGIRRGRSRAMPAPVAPRNRAWHEILHPDKKSPQGGGLVQARLWPIARNGAHGVTVDILTSHRRLLEQYQAGTQRHITIARAVEFLRDQRGAVLNTGRMGEFYRDRRHKLSRGQQNAVLRISDWLYRTHPQSPDWRLMMHYRGYNAGAGIDAMRRDFSAVFGVQFLPRVAVQPAREVVAHVRTWARANIGDWYLSILRKLATGNIKPARLTKTGPGGLTRTA